MNVYVNTVARFSKESGISANARGQNGINYAAVPVSVSLVIEAIVNTAISSGLRVVFAASRS